MYTCTYPSHHHLGILYISTWHMVAVIWRISCPWQPYFPWQLHDPSSLPWQYHDPYYLPNSSWPLSPPLPLSHDHSYLSMTVTLPLSPVHDSHMTVLTCPWQFWGCGAACTRPQQWGRNSQRAWDRGTRWWGRHRCSEYSRNLETPDHARALR